MNSKKNSFKRVAAGALAVLTVAAYAAPANVGGLLENSSVLTAEAAETYVAFNYDNSLASSFVSITDTVNPYTTSQIEAGNGHVNLAEGKTVVIKSSIPLEFKKAQGEGSGVSLTPADDKLTSAEANGVFTYTFTMPVYAVTASDQKTAVIISKANTIYRTNKSNDTKYTEAAFEGTIKVDGEDSSNNGTPATIEGRNVENLRSYQLTTNKKVKFTADKPFKLYTWSGLSNESVVTVKSTYSEGNYVATYTVPKKYVGNNTDANYNANFETLPQVAIVKASDAVTLTKSSDGTSVIANGESAENVTAAAITAKYTKTNATTGIPEDIKIANNGKVDNGTVVTLNISTIHQFLAQNVQGNYYTISVTKDGSEILTKDQASPNPKDIKYNNGESSNYTFSKAGKYKVDVEVYQKNSTGTTLIAYNLSYTFEIASLGDLAAENVKLKATAATGKLKGATADEDNTTSSITKYGITGGVVTFEVTEDFKEGDTVTIDPTLFYIEDGTEKVFGGAGNKPMTVTATGSLVASKVDDVQEVTIKYSNDEYASSKPITIKWKLVDAAKIPAMEWATGEDDMLTTSVDEIDNLRADILNTITLRNIDAADVEFEYIEGLNGSIDADELDEHFAGLPTEIGKYSVFVRYNDESMLLLKLTINNHSAYVVPAESDLTVDFGDTTVSKTSSGGYYSEVVLKDYEVEDADGKDVKVTFDSVTANIKKPVFDAKGNLTYEIDASGKVTNRYKVTDLVGTNGLTTLPTGVADTAKNKNADVTEAGGSYFLKPGTYILEVQGNGSSDKEYSGAMKRYIFTVNAKQLTADMILIDPAEYTGAAIKPAIYGTGSNANELIHAVAKYPGLAIKVGGGTTSASAVGNYNITIVSDTDDYKGSVSVPWHIVKNATSSELTTLKWDENATAIYDNGRIHVEVNRPADDAFSGKISRYGVIIEKGGKLTAPATKKENGVTSYVTDDPAYAAARKALVVGNGFTEGNQSAKQKAATPLVYGANIRVSDVETSIWVRPYIELDNGQIYYGQVKCLNLVQEATQKLNLVMSSAGTTVNGVAEAAVTKEVAYKTAASTATKLQKRQGIRSGYNDKTGKFYVYGSYTIPEKSENSDTAVTTFGVVVDKTGKINRPAAENFVPTEAEIEEAAKKLIIGEGFIEGHADPDSKTMEGDEYGANIKPQDSVTGVWVRAYVNLGRGKDDNGKDLDKDTIVYTDPIYIKPVSEQYADKKPEFTNDSTEANNNTGIIAKTASKAHLQFDPFAAPTGATIKQAGVVVDKTGSLYTEITGDGTTTRLPNADASAKLLLGKGYTEGKKTNFTDPTYKANVTPASGKFVVARPYVIYTINGIDVTLYGNVDVIDTVQTAGSGS